MEVVNDFSGLFDSGISGEGFVLTQESIDKGAEAMRNRPIFDPPFTPVEDIVPDELVIDMIKCGYKLILHPNRYKRIKDKLLNEPLVQDTD